MTHHGPAYLIGSAELNSLFKSKMSKQNHELDIFLRFLEITQIPVDIKSISQLPPPNPDICCILLGVDYGFELTALTEKHMEYMFSTRKLGYTNYRINTLDAVKRIESKGTKKYSVNNVDLVLHEGFTPIEDLWNCNQADLNYALQSATDKTNFIRVWVVDFSNKIYRCYSRAINKNQ